MATVIMYTGEQKQVFPINPGTGFELTELYQEIGNGCDIIEVIPLADGRIMVLDEEGKFRQGYQDRYNKEATVLLHQAGGMAMDWVTGNVVICSGLELQ